MSVDTATPASAGPPQSRSEAVEKQAARIKATNRRRRIPLLPALIFVIITTQLPFLVTVILSFLDWNALRPNQRGFAGFSNYVEVFTDASLRRAVVTTVVLTATVVIISLLLGLGIALLLDRPFRGRAIVRTMLIAPFLVVPVAAALIWKHAILNPTYGLINGILTWIWGLFGSDSPPQPVWLTQFPLVSIEATLIWQWTPFMMLILLAGLQSRPLDAVEAARMDGASAVQIFRYITLPHLRRYLELGGLLGSIYVVQNFDAVFTLTAGALGTANLPYAIYQTVFNAQEYGVASAMGVVTVAGTIIIATFALRVVSSLFEEENR
jgi:sorbitol/mannitol transport system permease protein